MNFDLASIGYLGISLIIFTETGMLFGILLPGDSLLFAAGVMAAQGYFNVWIMSGLCFLAAFIGNLIGYWIGQRFGLPVIEKYQSRFIEKDKIEKTRDFLIKYQGIGLVSARFIPGARTLAPVMAGILDIKFIPFVFYSFLGALVWGAGLTLLGYYLGYLIPPSFTHYLLLPVLGFIAIMVFWPYLREKFKKPGV